MRKDSGTAGLNILLSVITLLFVIGLVVMILALMSGELQKASYTSTTGSVTNEKIDAVTQVPQDLSYASYRDASCTVSTVTNATGGETLDSGNYTMTNCAIATTAVSTYNNTNLNVSYAYGYNADSLATKTINDTGGAIAGVTAWFPIIVVITAMVVLILLTVIIITAIRGSGMVATA